MMKSFCRSIGDVITTDDATMVENIFSGKLYTTNSLLVDFIQKTDSMRVQHKEAQQYK